MTRRRRCVALTLALGLVACDRSAPHNLGGRFVEVVDVPPEPTRAIDILFVIDNSGSMSEEQLDLARLARSALFTVLEQALGEPPDLHVAFTSSNVGVGNHAIQGCQDGGDRGRFRSGGHAEACPAMLEGFISDVAGANGERVTNYTGAFDDVFACAVQLGTLGCGFERHFDAMKLALDGSNPGNDGFLRPDALLAVVILTDEDDCSASDNALFAPETSDALGALNSFRCFEQGVTCDGDDPRAPGPREGCSVRDDPAYLRTVGEYVEFLRTLKPDPTKVMVVAISGASAPVVVGLDSAGNDPELVPVCNAAAGNVLAYPSFRVPALVDALPARSSWKDICGGVEAALRRGAHTVANVAAARPCLNRAPRDLDLASAGVQPDCRGFDVVAPGRPDEQRSAVPACSASGGREPCFEVVAAESCAGAAPLEVQVRRAAVPPAAHFVLECHVE